MRRNKKFHYIVGIGSAIIVAVILLALLQGCAGVNPTFVKAVETNWKVIGPDYRGYVEGDSSLAEESKKIRLQAIDEFTLLVAEAVDQVEDKK